MYRSHTDVQIAHGGRLMLVEGGLIERDFRKRDVEKWSDAAS
jgi:hypothetical protein